MKLKLFIILMGVFISSENPSFKDRFSVPFNIRYGVSLGYNDNVFKFSESEKEDLDSLWPEKVDSIKNY